MEEFETIIRDQLVEGVGPWVWPKEDNGAWLGPSEEFAAIRDEVIRFSRAKNVIVQAGGCAGMYPLLWSKHFKEVYTFEPAPLNWYCLVQNCPEDRIHKFNSALGENETTVFLKIHDLQNVGMNMILHEERRHETNVIEVPQITIDGLNLTACDAIQLDIETYEASALLGAEATITKFRPVISIETKPDSDPAIVMLTAWNYRKVATSRADLIFAPIEFS